MTDHPSQLPKRRWFQFRLKTLLVLTAVICLSLGWMLRERRRIEDQRDVLNSLGGGPILSGRIQQPSWRVWLLGDDAPAYAFEMDFSGRVFPDYWLTTLEGFPRLRTLILDRTLVTDSGLVHLERLTQLQSLQLKETQVTDAGVARLQKALPNCEIKH